MVSNYPVQFDVDFPSRPLDRLSTAFRLLLAIPIVILITMLTGETLRDDDHTNAIVIGGAAGFLPPALLSVLRPKQPRPGVCRGPRPLRLCTPRSADMRPLDRRYPSAHPAPRARLCV